VLIWHRMTLRTFLYVEITFRVAFVAKRKHFAVGSCEPSPFFNKKNVCFSSIMSPSNNLRYVCWLASLSLRPAVMDFPKTAKHFACLDFDVQHQRKTSASLRISEYLHIKSSCSYTSSSAL